MKKSNFLLLGTLATFLLLLLGLHLMVAARFKSGQYKTLSEDAWMADFTWMTLAPAKVIEVKDVSEVKLYSAAESKWGHEKNSKDDFKSQRVGDTMRIWATEKDGFKTLRLFVDSTIQLKASGCNVVFNGVQSGGPAAINASLDKSVFSMRTFEDDSAHLDALTIDATNNSTVNLHRGSVGLAHIRLYNSRLASEKANVKEISLQADDASGIEISSKQLRLLQAKQ